MLKRINVYNDLTKEDLSNDLLLIADACGIEVVRILLEKCSGIQFYIPNINKIKPIYIRRITTFNKENVTNKEIAFALNISEEYVRQLKLEIKRDMKNAKI